MGDRFDFAEDERGVSGVVGFILVFAILVILLSINQAQVVPAENSEVEFQHFQEVRDDLVEVRSAISTAGQTDVSQFPTVKLGTDYPPRILAVNPPPATGTLRTSEAYNITITDASGTTERIETRFIEYRPNYNELDVGSTWYENSVLYLDERDQGGLIVIEEQGLVVGDDSLRITALQNDVEKRGTKAVTLELYPTDASDVNISDLNGELTVTLPTRLTGPDYWTGAFDDEPAFSPTVDQDWYETGVHALNFSVQKEKVTVNTVGVQAMPEGTSAKQNVGVGDGEEDGDENGGENGVWSDCPDPPSAPGQNQPGVIYITSSTTGNVNAGGDTVVVEDGVSFSNNINKPGKMFIGDDASLSTNIGADGVIVVGENSVVSGNVNDGSDLYLLPGSSISGNVMVNGQIYLSNTNQVNGNINDGTVNECSVN
jgi:hypothetical protein